MFTTTLLYYKNIQFVGDENGGLSHCINFVKNKKLNWPLVMKLFNFYLILSHLKT